jgi:DNA-binding MarR family transcriptional regulator
MCSVEPSSTPSSDESSPEVTPRSEGPSDSPTRQEWVGRVIELVHAIDHAWQSLATHAGLSLNELITLEHLYFSGAVSSPALRRRTGLTASAITGLIDRLERRDLVRRVRPADDRRVVMVELTEHGQPYAQSLFHPLLDLLGRSSPVATPPELGRQLTTISSLIEFFDHVASATPTLYRTPPVE